MHVHVPMWLTVHWCVHWCPAPFDVIALFETSASKISVLSFLWFSFLSLSLPSLHLAPLPLTLIVLSHNLLNWKQVRKSFDGEWARCAAPKMLSDLKSFFIALFKLHQLTWLLPICCLTHISCMAQQRLWGSCEWRGRWSSLHTQLLLMPETREAPLFIYRSQCRCVDVKRDWLGAVVCSRRQQTVRDTPVSVLRSYHEQFLVPALSVCLSVWLNLMYVCLYNNFNSILIRLGTLYLIL